MSVSMMPLAAALQPTRSSSSKRSSLSGIPSSSHSYVAPVSARHLEQMSIEIEASLKHVNDVRYVIRVHHKQSQMRWSLSRSFDEYRAFQTRVLDLLRQGHFCHAECPWIYSFVASYFPKSSMFRSASSRTVTKRREALEKCLQKLQSFVLTRENHSCSVAANVATELLNFVCGSLVDTAEFELCEKAHRDSASSILSSTDDESDIDAKCPLCDLGFTEESGPCCSYTTTLKCGHEFHEECILSKLNESMHCPVCGHSELE
ncbi:hypothetical protein Poli38472_011689 [Pythium oligandrum]|uniref:RING-type domain-containing protein n=1 Tax=Pythium oligandrum TaxID=41045 RepID=A0A8K1C7J7_PYTOL|nr:hypothetical protein Poli38472_011689 [Pythium oligandrum]|eukprot:TMW58101.1 hypothetical protein Poli38472_011689 [Pythium oligandrum]